MEHSAARRRMVLLIAGTVISFVMTVPAAVVIERPSSAFFEALITVLSTLLGFALVGAVFLLDDRRTRTHVQIAQRSTRSLAGGVLGAAAISTFAAAIAVAAALIGASAADPSRALAIAAALACALTFVLILLTALDLLQASNPDWVTAALEAASDRPGAAHQAIADLGQLAELDHEGGYVHDLVVRCRALGDVAVASIAPDRGLPGLERAREALDHLVGLGRSTIGDRDHALAVLQPLADASAWIAALPVRSADATEAEREHMMLLGPLLRKMCTAGVQLLGEVARQPWPSRLTLPLLLQISSRTTDAKEAKTVAATVADLALRTELPLDIWEEIDTFINELDARAVLRADLVVAASDAARRGTPPGESRDAVTSRMAQLLLSASAGETGPRALAMCWPALTTSEFRSLTRRPEIAARAGAAWERSLEMDLASEEARRFRLLGIASHSAVNKSRLPENVRSEIGTLRPDGLLAGVTATEVTDTMEISLAQMVPPLLPGDGPAAEDSEDSEDERTMAEKEAALAQVRTAANIRAGVVTAVRQTGVASIPAYHLLHWATRLEKSPTTPRTEDGTIHPWTLQSFFLVSEYNPIHSGFMAPGLAGGTVECNGRLDLIAQLLAAADLADRAVSAPVQGALAIAAVELAISPLAKRPLDEGDPVDHGPGDWGVIPAAMRVLALLDVATAAAELACTPSCTAVVADGLTALVASAADAPAGSRPADQLPIDVERACTLIEWCAVFEAEDTEPAELDEMLVAAAVRTGSSAITEMTRSRLDRNLALLVDGTTSVAARIAFWSAATASLASDRRKELRNTSLGAILWRSGLLEGPVPDDGDLRAAEVTFLAAAAEAHLGTRSPDLERILAIAEATARRDLPAAQRIVRDARTWLRTADKVGSTRFFERSLKKSAILGNLGKGSARRPGGDRRPEQ